MPKPSRGDTINATVIAKPITVEVLANQSESTWRIVLSYGYEDGPDWIELYHSTLEITDNAAQVLEGEMAARNVTLYQLVELVLDGTITIPELTL